jgi:hypothetical protein
MQQIWHGITDGNEFWCDRNTLEKLEGLAPKWSSRDRSIVEALFDSNQAFCRVSDPAVRSQIFHRILDIDGYILTFRTFFKHVKVLGPIMLRLRELFPASDLFPTRSLLEPVQRRPVSVKDVLLQKYYNDSKSYGNNCLIQYNEHDERYIQTPRSAVYSYWQLCLSLVRYEQETWTTSKKRKLQREGLEYPEWVIRLGQLARKLGFESDAILALCSKDAGLSQIQINMRKERPNCYYTVTAEDFETEARSRQRGQQIFKLRQASPSPLMTTETDTSNVVPKTHKELFLPTIWVALAQEARYALTDFGKLLLVLTSFFGDFESGQVSLDGVILGAEASTLSPPFPNHVVEKEAPENSRRSSSIYSSPDEPRSQEPTLPRSMVYSIPAYPEIPDEPVLASNDEHIFFWYLPASRFVRPTLEFTCKATKDEIMQVVKNIQTHAVAPAFGMVDKADRLKLCPSWDIHQRRKSSKTPHNVYYVYDIENVQTWISKELANT